MILSRVLFVLVLGLGLVGCGDVDGDRDAALSVLPVGTTTWDADAPAWLHDGILHVGERVVDLGAEVDSFVLTSRGVYWTRGGELFFTSPDGRSETVGGGRWDAPVVSVDRSVLAVVDRAHGPTDQYGTHVRQVVVFDTRTGAQLYRTPDREPDAGADLTDLYEEVPPTVVGLSREQVFFDGATIDLRDGTATPTTRDDDGLEVYAGFADTLFPDGFHVGIRAIGGRRELADSEIYGSGRLSPDRSRIFDTTTWPTPAVAYDAATGRARPIEAPWDHLVLVAFAGDRFTGIAQHIVEDYPGNVVRAEQVVTCVVRTLACTPVSPVVPTEDGDPGRPTLLAEGSSG